MSTRYDMYFITERIIDWEVRGHSGGRGGRDSEGDKDTVLRKRMRIMEDVVRLIIY